MKRKTSITIRHSIFISKPKELVWDFTQDYTKRSGWDKAVLEATVLQDSPRIVKMKMRGKTEMTFIYKWDDRPNKTTLTALDITSSFIESAGGSWTYETRGTGTLWTQTNTIGFKKQWLLSLLLPFYQWLFDRQTKAGMKQAKSMIEGL